MIDNRMKHNALSHFIQIILGCQHSSKEKVLSTGMTNLPSGRLTFNRMKTQASSQVFGLRNKLMIVSSRAFVLKSKLKIAFSQAFVSKSKLNKVSIWKASPQPVLTSEISREILLIGIP